MYICLRFFLLILIIAIFLHVQAQPALVPVKQDKSGAEVKTDPKREFRAAWVATVENIDWPSHPGLPPEQQKKELTNLLDFLKGAGMNAVMLQIRPAADAFYAKSREPWSRWLTGKQGQGPLPEYDPLEFAINEAHKRGMELHAWFNPYRATNDGKFALLSPQHITRIKPEWFFIYGGIKLFNPGIPEVRDYIVKVFLDVVENYDIDGVHMDDYFYPYKIEGQHLNDTETFKAYGDGFDDINDWRRNNVDTLIHMLSDSIHKHKPRIKFGISPFGVWANKFQNREGSDTHGLPSYYELFADSRKWIKEGWLDYINPQIYFPIGDRSVPYDKLLDWWSDNTYNRHLYIGIAAYRIGEHRKGKFRDDPAAVPDEIAYLRKNPRVQGSVYFSTKSLENNPLGFTDSLKENYYYYPALPPVMLWLDSIPPNPPLNFTATVTPKNTVQLKWATPLLAKDKEPVYGYVIYRFEGNEKVNIEDPQYILHIQYDGGTTFTDDTAEKGKTYLYVVTALDRLKNESDPSPTIAAILKK